MRRFLSSLRDEAADVRRRLDWRQIRLLCHYHRTRRPTSPSRPGSRRARNSVALREKLALARNTPGYRDREFPFCSARARELLSSGPFFRSGGPVAR